MKTTFCRTLTMPKILLLLILKRNSGVRKIKRKLRYYKEVIILNLEDQKYLLVVTLSWKKINMAKIRMNSYEIHSKTGHWSIPKTP